MTLPYSDRVEAGRELAEALSDYAGRDGVLVLGLPRGGVPVAFEVAESLGAELDVMVVRKLGTPGQPELALGAIASGGGRVLNDDLVRQLGISESAIEQVEGRERTELARRETAYRGARADFDLRGRTVILVDDGLATGATMRAAVAATRRLEPQALVVAVPVAPSDTVAKLRREADDVVCLATPEPFMAVGSWYRDFAQTGDDEVRDLLARSWSRRGGGAQG